VARLALAASLVFGPVLPPALAGDGLILRPDRTPSATVVGDAAIELIHGQFLEYDPDYLEQIAERERRLDALGERLFALAEAGRDTECSRQIFIEAKWLVGYTAWWPRIDRRFEELEATFALEDQSFAEEPALKDGFYAICADERFIRIEDTLVHYFDMAASGEKPAIERKPLADLRSKERLTDFLEARLISNIPETGEDQRSRFGSLISILAAADKRDFVMEFVRETVRGADLTYEQQEALRDRFNALIDLWQDPASGYWGAWYRDGETLFRTTDLSITYHIVHARRGEVKHWPELIDTTFALREQIYPFGWMSDGHWTNHNNYDLARLFKYGWPHMTDRQQAETARTLQEMVDWSFAETVQPDYAGFVADPKLSSSLESTFYFGASFLVAAGYFDEEPWFGPLAHPAPVPEVCRAMIAYGKTLDGPLVAGGVGKLEEACKSHLS
jgi:hypothetical protein